MITHINELNISRKCLKKQQKMLQLNFVLSFIAIYYYSIIEIFRFFFSVLKISPSVKVKTSI